MKTITANLTGLLAIACMTFPAHALAESAKVRIYLKIFDKRDSVTFVNGRGLFLDNDATRPRTRLDIKKKGGAFTCNGRQSELLTVTPRTRSITKIITEYGEKSYDGSFTIRIKNNSFFIINTTSLNSYLQGVVGSELGDSFSPEALSAQAVVSRSYYTAIKKKTATSDYDAIDTAGRFQAFRGLQYAGPRVKRAVASTSCEILSIGGDDFIPQFHSTCGGILLTAEESWGSEPVRDRPGFRRNDGPQGSPNCRISPYFEWSADLKKSTILEALSKRMKKDFEDIAFSIDSSGFLREVTLVTSGRRITKLRGCLFKSYLEREGISAVRSTRMSVRSDGGIIHFRGYGFGHFIGMCQWGAEYLARKGTGYRDILKYYYPTAVVAYLDDCP